MTDCTPGRGRRMQQSMVFLVQWPPMDRLITAWYGNNTQNQWKYKNPERPERPEAPESTLDWSRVNPDTPAIPL
jgi:hypothetical protein